MSKKQKSVFGRGFITLMILITGIFFALPGSVSAAPADQTVWRLDWYLPKGDPETVWLQQACDDILEFTGGRLKIDVYPSFSLKINPGTQLKNLRDGLMEIACMNVEMLEGMEPSLAVTEAPGIWANKADQAKAVDAMVPFKEKTYADPWGCHYVATKMMAVQMNGIFTTKKPIKTLSDLAGVKMRASSRRSVAPLKALGAAPQSMPSGEVYMALKTGVLDGAQSGSRILIYQKWGEVVKYGIEGQLTSAIAQDICVNQKAWDSIPKDIQEVVTMRFKALGDMQRTMAIMPGTSDHWRRQCEGMGVQYSDWSKGDLDKLEDLFAEEWYKELEKATPRTKEAWDLVKKYTVNTR
ncbi:MAG: TRAP transporter substrate-binding protein DctP [Deltaproteobacteria bacterium]|nr:TRAP transporter substrate-binding protein DctP [Deltaproteobacteria bacterium]